jgi:ABC-type Fe3+-hydroxamate transport system substrate-binding protein
MTHRNLRLVSLALALLFCLCDYRLRAPVPLPVEDGHRNNSLPCHNKRRKPRYSGANYAVNLTDMAGNTVQLDSAVSSIVVLDPAIVNWLYALGAGSLVVGRTAECDYPNEVNAIPFVTVDGKADPDLVILLAPQWLCFPPSKRRTRS